MIAHALKIRGSEDAMILYDYSQKKGVADEPHWNEFVVEVGGCLLAPLIKRAGVKNADYSFPGDKIVAELKILETEFAHTKGATQKIIALAGKYPGMDPDDVDQPLRKELIGIIKKPLQKIVTKANRQIRETKIELGYADWKGILICVNDNFRGVPPTLVMGTLAHIMSGTSYKSIEAIIYITNHYIEIAENPFANLFWSPMYIDEHDDHLANFVNDLGRKWRLYLEREIGPFDNSEERDYIDLTKISVVKGPFRSQEYIEPEQ